MKLRNLLIATLFVLAFAQTAQACGSYQTCNMIQIQDVRITPNPVDSGQPVTIEIDTFEFANWYYTVNSMLFQPQIMITVGGRQYPAQLSYSSMSSTYPYGYWWYGMIWFTQYAQFTHTFTWDGKDYNGEPVTEDQELIIVAYAGAAMDGHFETISVIPPQDSGKNLGEPECPIGDPCNPATGNVYKSEIDYQSGDPNLRFERSYNSLWDQDIGLGMGWTSNLFRRLEIEGDRLTVRASDGRSEPMRLVDGVWQADPDSQLLLSSDVTGFTIQYKDGATERYNIDGFLLNETDLSGNSQNYSYNLNNQLISVTGTYGHTLELSYDASGHVIAMQDSAGQIWQLTYAVNANSTTQLVQVDYPNGSYRKYHYDDLTQPDLLSGVEDGNGHRFVSYSYDDSKKVIRTEFPDTGSESPQEPFDFVYETGITTVIDGLGNSEIFTTEENLGAQNVISRIKSDGKGFHKQYDENNRLLSFTDAEGNITIYNYNASGQRIETIEAQGTPQERSTQFEYLNTDLNLITRIISSSVHEGQVSEQQITYGANYNPISITNSGFKPDGTSLSQTITLAYDTKGRLISTDGYRVDVDDITHYSYYDCTTGFECGQLSSITNAEGHTHHYNAYDAHGRLTQETDPNGIVTEYVYDPLGHVTQITEDATGVTPRITTLTYDGAFQLKSITYSNGFTLTYTYDSAHDLRIVSDALGNQIEYSYDLAGNRINERHTDPNGVLNRNIEMNYDIRQRLSEINTAGSITALLNDSLGNQLVVTDPNENGQSNSFDSLNRLIESIDAIGGVTSYNYSNKDKLTSVLTPNGAETKYIYDDLGNLLERNSPDTGVTTSSYDSAGNRITTTDARGVTATLQYDAIGRVTSIDYPGLDGDSSYQYDNCANGIGRLCTIVDSTGYTAYEYDTFGSILSETHSLEGTIYTFNYNYDNAGRIASMSYPDGRVVRYTRDLIGRTKTIDTEMSGVITPLLTNIAYWADNLPSHIQYGNGIHELAEYDLQSRLIRQVLNGNSSDYSYDPAGNLTNVTSNDLVGQYGYDELNRINEENSTLVNNLYQYDSNGNRTQRSSQNEITTYTLDMATNRLSTINGQSLVLDETGNTLNQGQHQYSYNTKGRLTEVIKDGELVASYKYNAQGQRVMKQTPNQTTHYHYNLSGHLILESRSDGTVQRVLFWNQQQPVAQMDIMMGQGNGKAVGINKGKAEPKASENAVTEVFTWLHTDHLQPPRYGTNSNGDVVWRWNSEAFGLTYPDEDPDGDGRNITINLRFPGQYYDQETGLHYNYFRTYDPSTGRYLESDPIGLNGGLNTYAYVGGNPINFYDPFGLEEYPDDFMGPLPPSGYHTSEMTQTKCGKVPPAPPGADINKNMEEADKKWNPTWFYDQVRNKGPWDYKQQGRKYEDFGNFNFGATGSAFGFPSDILHRGAGWANQKADPTRKGLGSPWGKYPYGDDPSDQNQISNGVNYCECMGY